jgi:hypothetical protein
MDIPYISHPRKGKKLLVLDLDYTLFDYKLLSSDSIQGARPLASLFPAGAVYSLCCYRCLVGCAFLLSSLEICLLVSYSILLVLLEYARLIVVAQSRNDLSWTSSSPSCIHITISPSGRRYLIDNYEHIFFIS